VYPYFGHFALDRSFASAPLTRLISMAISFPFLHPRTETSPHSRFPLAFSHTPYLTFLSSPSHLSHNFLQPSIVARFEPPHLNASDPVTIIGAHQDSANYLFPLLPAPGADDDMSGSVSILEAFRVLAMRGYIPNNGGVEFHWYAAEEAGLLGSQDLARYRKDQGVNVGAMLEMVSGSFL
jgi:leucyl aminopeptidase